jgi:hypothetical protein
MPTPFASHVSPEHAVNWSEDLEVLHGQSSRKHCIDVWTRRAVLARMGLTVLARPRERRA